MKESLSALMDGELSEHEQAEVLAELANQPELARTWERYHLIQAALRKELGAVVLTGLSERVVKRIGKLLAPSATASARRNWGLVARWAGGLALAASVTGIAIFGLQSLAPNGTGSGSAQLAIVADPPAQGQLVPSGVVNWGAGRPEVARLLNAYLVEHNEVMPTSDIKGVMTYGHVVGYEESK
jgi:sigma-E factor negative regulatory protein RseA